MSDFLDSAAHRPRAVLYGKEAYPTIDRKAAALLQSLVDNHALVDGNRRLGWLSTVVFYGLNGIDVQAPDDPAFDLVMAVASGHGDLALIATTLAGWHS
ncbi:type II toxin-antitoxin system death-on-curing family toxin [Rudaeicoccus suwonensis]|uniref:type II toxin-antitoxin system death-on-curing family toxin n=1 Tax=Rudaeicoccus suwonensis TaxID=657409 RepID=UPI00319E7314